MFTPDEQEDVERLVERMQRAGWIDKVMWTPQDIHPQFTELGRRRIAELYRAAHELYCEEMEKPSLTDLAFIWRLALLDSTHEPS